MKEEYKSYNDFRNMIRNLLHKVENNSIRLDIDNEIKKRFVLFSVKQTKIVSLIERLLTNKQNDNREFGNQYDMEMDIFYIKALIKNTVLQLRFTVRKFQTMAEQYY